MTSITALAPLSSPRYRPLFLAMVLAIFGQGAWNLYLAMQVLELGADPPTLAGVVMWSGVGLLAASLPAGVVADRLSKKGILVAVLVVNAVAAGVVSGLATMGAAQYWLLGLSALIVGASTAFFFPAYTALVPLLVEEEQLMAVNGLEGATRPVVGQALAPALTGAVIGATTPPAGGLLIVLSLAAGAVLAARLPAVGPPDTNAAPQHPFRDLAEGFTYVLRTRWVRSSVLFAAVMGLVTTGVLEVLLPVLLRDGHENGAAVYGAVLAALGVGGLVGSLIAGGMEAPRRFLPVMVGVWALACVPLALPAWTLNPWIIGAGLMLYGAGIGVGMVIWGTVLQAHVPLDMLGRVASLDFFVSIAFMPLSVGLVGAVSATVAPGALFVAAGMVPLALAGVLALAGQLRSDEPHAA
ncbi:MFS transporter [Micrococcus luteus]|nr:MFS transporter [Micrococcus luteus]